MRSSHRIAWTIVACTLVLAGCRDEGGRDALLTGGPGCAELPGEDELRDG